MSKSQQSLSHSVGRKDGAEAMKEVRRNDENPV